MTVPNTPDVSASAERVACSCLAYDPVHDDHTEAEHTRCGATYRGPDGACGGCHDCMSAQVFYWQQRRRESGGAP